MDADRVSGGGRGLVLARDDAVRPRRKAIPYWIRQSVGTHQNWRCAVCQVFLGDEIEFDHRPPLVMRPIRDDGSDYVPLQLDPRYIDALHPRCHLQRTVGRKPDAEKTVTTKGSDAWAAKKFRRLENPKRRRAKIPSRPFPKAKSKFL